MHRWKDLRMLNITTIDTTSQASIVLAFSTYLIQDGHDDTLFK